MNRGSMNMENRRGVARRDLILAYILQYQQQNGFPPSVSEISTEVGSVRSNVHHHLRVLSKEGRLTSTSGFARSWVVKH
jgi:SOS-response transcriptional repressor LexA